MSSFKSSCLPNHFLFEQTHTPNHSFPSTSRRREMPSKHSQFDPQHCIPWHFKIFQSPPANILLKLLFSALFGKFTQPHHLMASWPLGHVGAITLAGSWCVAMSQSTSWPYVGMWAQESKLIQISFKDDPSASKSSLNPNGFKTPMGITWCIFFNDF